MYGTASWVHQVVYSLSGSARHSTQPRLEASSPTLHTVAAALQFITAAADPPPASARSELGMHTTLVLEALLGHIPDYPLATAALRFLLAAADPLPPSATPDVDVYSDIASASLCATGPTFSYCFSLRDAVGAVLGSLASVEALSVFAVAILPTPWFQDMAVRVFRHVSGIDHFEEQLRSEVARWENDTKNASSRFADLGQEHQQVLERTTLGSALVKEHLRQHVFEDSGETLEGLRRMVARVERDRKAAEADAQQRSEANARVLTDIEALERMAVPAIGDDLETLSVGDADVGALKQDLVAHTSATATVRADEQRQKAEHATAMAPLPGQLVCAMHELDSCQARLDTVAAVDGNLQLAPARVISPVDAAHPSDRADAVLDIVQRRLRNFAAEEALKRTIEKRTGQLIMACEIVEDTRDARDFSENEYFSHIMVCSNEKDTMKQELDLHQYEDNRREKEHEQTATAYTAGKAERDDNIATLKQYTEDEGATKKQTDDDMAALEAEDAKITELETTVPGKTQELRQLRQQQDEADRARLAETNTATAADNAHHALIAHCCSQRTTANADEDAAAQTIADGRHMLAQTKASTVDSSTHAAAEHKVLEEKHRDGLIALQNDLQNATAAEYSAIQAKRVELLRIEEEAKVELAAKEDEKRAIQKQITPAINKKMKVQKEGDIDRAAYARKLEQLRTRNRELFAAMIAWDEAKKREYHTARALYDRVRKGKWAERPEAPQFVQGSSRDATPERDMDEGLAVARDIHAQESSRNESRETTPEREGTPSLVADSESRACSPSLSPRLPATPSLEAVERLLPLEDFKTSLLEELPPDFDTY